MRLRTKILIIVALFIFSTAMSFNRGPLDYFVASSLVYGILLALMFLFGLGFIYNFKKSSKKTIINSVLFILTATLTLFVFHVDRTGFDPSNTCKAVEPYVAYNEYTNVLTGKCVKKRELMCGAYPWYYKFGCEGE